MGLSIELDRDGALPLYQQIVEQVTAQIGDGRLPAGARLPTVRQLAEELGVTRLTVQNAYSELQADGWTTAVVGRGTFVSESVLPNGRTETLGRRLTPDGVVHDIVQLNHVTGVRSMAGAEADPNFFPTDELFGRLNRLQDEARDLLRYGATQGDPELRVALTDLLRERGVSAAPDDLIVTAGATQGLALVAQGLTRPGDTVVVEEPTFVGFFNILKAFGLQPIGVPVDDEGPRLDVLERIAVQHRPRFYYSIPTFHNPTGLCTSASHRREVRALAEQYGFFVVEDDIYSRLAYDDPSPPAMKAEDRSGVVVYVDSFSKVLIPGLRIGYVVAPPPLHDQLLSLQRAVVLTHPTLLQRALAGFLRDGGLKRHLQRVLPQYRRRRDALLQALDAYVPESVDWTVPAGGFSCWLTLPRHRRLESLYQEALERGVAFTPGDVFLVQPGTHRHLRLCFGNQTTEGIRLGVELLGTLIRERLEDDRPRDVAISDTRPLV